MSAVTPIQWTDRTWNPVRGCSRVSAGCDNCYAMGQAHRFSGPGKPYDGLTTIRRGKVDWTGKARFIPSALAEPLRWRKPQRIFVNSMSDLFHESLSDEEIAAVFGVMAACPQHTFQVLTKRPERMRKWFAWMTAQFDPRRFIAPQLVELAIDTSSCPSGTDPLYRALNKHAVGRNEWPLPNVWLGTSIESQATTDKRIPDLLKTPAAVRFISAEPLLSGLDLRPYLHRSKYRTCPRCLFTTNRHGSVICPNDAEVLGGDIALDWVIVGGESGPGARTFDVEWARAIVKQCADAKVDCFIKQLGANTNVPTIDKKGGDMSEWPADLRVRQFPEVRP